MNNYILANGRHHPVICDSMLITMFMIAFSMSSFAQKRSAVKGEMATCRVNVNMKEVKPQAKAERTGNERKKAYEVRPNQTGYFDQISNLLPEQTISIEINYPNAKQGDKGVIIVADGGSLGDGKKVGQFELNSQNNCLFDFKVAKDPGLYRVVVRKGDDLKVVQLWVGSEEL